MTDNKPSMSRPAERGPTVSVIIPAYNTAVYIRDALTSVFEQTFTDYEVIVVNDGSPDTEEMEKVLAPYLDRIIYLKQENRGPSAARNKAIEVSRGRFLALLDSDDQWMSDYLAVQLAMFTTDPSLDMVYPNALYFGNSVDAGKEFMDLLPSEGPVTFESIVAQRCNVMVSVMARREAIVSAGMFDESLHTSEDLDLWLRMLKRGHHIGYHRGVIVRYRRHAGSLASNPVRICNSTLRVFDKCERTMSLTTREHEVLSTQRNFFRSVMRFYEGKHAFFEGDVDGAVKALSEANVYFASRKISIALVLLRFAPRLLLWLYHFRDRYIYRTSTQF